MFLANYADGLSDLPLDQLIADFRRARCRRQLRRGAQRQSFHAVHADADGLVTHMGAMPEQQLWINGGFFVLRQEIFDYISEGEELVEQPFARLIAERKLATFRWDGFWQCMDTFKDKISFDRMEARGDCPWMVWRQHPASAPDVTGRRSTMLDLSSRRRAAHLRVLCVGAHCDDIEIGCGGDVAGAAACGAARSRSTGRC